MAKKKKTAVEVPAVKDLKDAVKYQRRIAACLRIMRAKQAKMKALKEDFDAKNAVAAALSEQVLKFAEAERMALAAKGEKPNALLIGTAGKVEWLATERVVIQEGFTEDQVIAQCEENGKDDYLSIKTSLNRQAMHDDPAGLVDIKGVDIETLEIAKVRPTGPHILECMERDPESRKWSMWAPKGSRTAAKPMLQEAAE